MLKKFKGIDRDIKLFILATFIFSFCSGIYDTMFNNFLNDNFKINSLQRTLLEFPRELPGVLMVFVAALLFFLNTRKLAALAFSITGVGLILMGTLSKSYNIMLVWLFIFSLGQHIFLPLNSSIVMELSEKGNDGRRLGQIQSLKNIAVILGAFFVSIGFKYIGLNYKTAMVMSGILIIISSFLINSMSAGVTSKKGSHLRFNKKYNLYYALTSLYGMRKQIFITFAPWALVTTFHKPVYYIANLMIIGSVVGIFVQPYVGKIIDTYGERVVLRFEALIFVFVCILYGFAPTWFPKDIAILIVSACYISDQTLMSLGIARATYIKKIAEKKEDISNTLSLGLSIDHFFAISVALIGGLLWYKVGYKAVFILGAIISLINFFVAKKININTEDVLVVEDSKA